MELAAGLADLLAQRGQQPAEVVNDLVVDSCAQQEHMIVHHTEGEAGEQVADIESTMAELFEDRVGQSLEEAMGHSH